MTEDAFIRARRPEQKAQRAEAILTAAAQVLDRAGIEGTTLAAIAAEAGVVKSGLYRYFESREEILLHLLAQEAAALIETVAGAYRRQTVPNDFPALGRIHAAGCAAHPRFCLILSQMAPLLEHNVSTERIAEMKRGFLPHLAAMADALHSAAPRIPPDRAAFAVTTVSHLVAGLWPAANPAPAVAAALAAPDLAPFRIDFEPTLAAATEAVLRGLAEAPPKGVEA